MATSARLGSLDYPMRELPPGTAATVEPTARKPRADILDDFPKAIEAVRPGGRADSIGVGTKMRTEFYVYVMRQAAYVNLGFWHGVGLLDSAGPLEGTGAKLRRVKVRSVEDARRLAVCALVAKALAERCAVLGGG